MKLNFSVLLMRVMHAFHTVHNMIIHLWEQLNANTAIKVLKNSINDNIKGYTAEKIDQAGAGGSLCIRDDLVCSVSAC